MCSAGIVSLVFTKSPIPVSVLFCIVAARLAQCVCRMFKPGNSAAGRSGEARNEWLTSVGACPSLSEDGDEVHGHKEVVVTAGMC